MMKLNFYVSALAALLFSGNSLAATEVSPKLKQNLEIMRNILQTSLEQSQNTNVSRISHSYLAGQGVLFRTSTRGQFGHYFAMAPMPPAAPMPPIDQAAIAAISARASAAANAALAGGHISESDIEDIAEQAEAQAEQMMEQQEQMQDQMRELREQSRDLERELRDIEREKRDIEFARKVGKEDAEQQKQLNQLNSKNTELQKRLADIKQKYAAWEQDFQKKRAEQAKLAAQKQAELITNISVNFANTLCDYGASLREIKDSEFVSLQLETSQGRDSKDIYWVFKKSDINQCVSGKLKAETLLKKADYYQY
ncbi:hypothetical protein [Rheinheimera sp. 4Y26]|uniref:hypothetical protein n=1 Tax=Rheinheimera sp. 4Y26 TaxID=2977811 RepID=UPI0021B0E442|nr:hypothetical protein [Rheinheimera sp. 4Y26]MCT6698760.1 hypothetical protein [Rheinheimera sp. 4Y26]